VTARLLVAGALCLACQAAEAPSGPAPRERSSALATRVKLDPGLVTTGRVKLEAAAPHRLAGVLRVSGEVRSNEEGSAEAGTLMPGRVASLEVGEGAKVKRGQVLAWVDAPEVARAASVLLVARAHALVAHRKRERQETLAATSATSQNALDEARAEDEMARAELLAARTLLLNLGGTEPPVDSDASSLTVRVPVRAPLAGIVAERSAVLGGAVSPERALFRIVAQGGVSLSVVARIPETAAQMPTAGDVATLTSRRAGTRDCQATVQGSVGGIDVATRTLGVRLNPEPNCAWLLPGSFVDVVFASVHVSAPASGVTIPRAAIVEVRGQTVVFVATSAPGEFDARIVQRGDADEARVNLPSGVSPGEQVVVEGTLLLKGELQRSELEGGG
jgi:membrane fusion protein, heavy metal efflux system